MPEASASSLAERPCVIFIIGVLLIPRENNQKSIENIETDIMDYDGIGNYGRIPDKNPKKL